MKINEVVCFDRAAYGAGKKSKFNFSICDDAATTLLAGGPGGAVRRFLSVMVFILRKQEEVEPAFWKKNPERLQTVPVPVGITPCFIQGAKNDR